MIVSILSPELGRLSAVARSVRKSKKRFMGGIDLFDCGEFELNPPRGDSTLWVLSGIRSRKPWPRLRTSLRKFALASLAIETAEALSHEGDPDAGLLYQPLETALVGIDASTSAQQAHESIIYFLLGALRECGYDPLHLPLPGSDEMRGWWQQMVQQDQPLPAPGEKVLSRSFSVLCGFVEKTLNRALRSRSQLGL